MAINLFEGARRIALLTAGVAILGTLIAVFIYEPYVSATYSIAHPSGPFVRMDEPCPSDASKHYFTTKTSTGKNVSINLCLLTMSFGAKSERLIPYKVDEQGMIWGAASYSSEVSAHERKLEQRFKIPQGEEEAISKKLSRDYRDNLTSSLGYLIVGLAIFGGVVWAIGWIVRGFLGIPRGMDKRPD